MILGVLGAIWSRVGWYVLGALAILGALVGLYFGIRQGGRIAERLEGAQKALEVARGRREIDRQIDAMPDPAVDDFLRTPDRRQSKGRK